MAQPRTRDELLETRVAALADYVLSIECHPGCDRPALVPVRSLVRRYGQLQLHAVLRQLRCTRCKRPPARVSIADHVVDGEMPTLRIKLVP